MAEVGGSVAGCLCAAVFYVIIKRVLGRYLGWVLLEAGFRPKAETEIDNWGERYCKHVYWDGFSGCLA